MIIQPFLIPQNYVLRIENENKIINILWIKK